MMPGPVVYSAELCLCEPSHPPRIGGGANAKRKFLCVLNRGRIIKFTPAVPSQQRTTHLSSPLSISHVSISTVTQSPIHRIVECSSLSSGHYFLRCKLRTFPLPSQSQQLKGIIASPGTFTLCIIYTMCAKVQGPFLSAPTRPMISFHLDSY